MRLETLGISPGVEFIPSATSGTQRVEVRPLVVIIFTLALAIAGCQAARVVLVLGSVSYQEECPMAP